MKKVIAIISLLVMTGVPTILTAAEFPEHLLGRVVIDVSSNGEAWYINPQSRMRVYLGRPEEALERLTARTVYLSYLNIARIAPENGQAEDGDLEYVAQVAGNIMTPNDLVGAAWYIDPDRQVRRRLATAYDAWRIMQDGVPVSSVDLAGIPIEGLDLPRFTRAEVSAVIDGTTLSLTDGREVSLLSVSVPSNEDLQAAAKAHLEGLLVGQAVVLERDSTNVDADKRLWRFVHLDDVNVNLDLVRRGLAFDDINSPDYRYAEQLIVARLDAMRLSSGMWDN
ncbi:thermonuclease family protein [Patescibacteria group bacterium]|nr:thermonuclease family protein [Patescibacteria group bacterium]